VSLGDLPGGSFNGHAYSVSADGSVVVGASDSALGREAFIWDSANGMRSLNDVLRKDFGLDLAGYTLTEAHGISDDGLTIVGYGRNRAGIIEAWRALFPSPPKSGFGSDLITFIGFKEKLKR
jgi:probable HAF family extracellular repeat protein